MWRCLGVVLWLTIMSIACGPPTAAHMEPEDDITLVVTDDDMLVSDKDIPGLESFIPTADELAEQRIASCMADYGFPYVPFVSPDRVVDYASEPPGSLEYVRILEDTRTLEHVRSFGFKISTRQLHKRPVDDPNRVIREAIDVKRRDDYDRALSACQERASQPNSDYGQAAAEFWGEFGFELAEQVHRARMTDERVLARQFEWVACMADQGHVFAGREDMFHYLNGAFRHRVTPLISGDEPDSERLQPLIDEELDIAVADFECAQALIATLSEVSEDLERGFVASNLDRLLAFKEAHPALVPPTTGDPVALPTTTTIVAASDVCRTDPNELQADVVMLLARAFASPIVVEDGAAMISWDSENPENGANVLMSGGSCEQHDSNPKYGVDEDRPDQWECELASLRGHRLSIARTEVEWWTGSEIGLPDRQMVAASYDDIIGSFLGTNDSEAIDDATSQRASARRDFRYNATKRELDEDFLSLNPDYPGIYPYELGDQLVTFGLTVTPVEATLLGDGLIRSIAVVSVDGVVKYNRWLWEHYMEGMERYWADCAAG